MMDKKKVGDIGERIACEYLVKKGYKILGRNYRIKFGEIDIIAKKRWRFKDLFGKNPLTNSSTEAHPKSSGRAIHFVEVKTIIDSNDGFFPEERVNYKKKRKLIGLCQIWLEKNGFTQNYPYQIDIIGIIINKNSQKVKVNFFENVVSDNC